MVKWLICSVLLSGLWWDSGYRLRSKSRFSPPSPITPTPLSLLHCWLPVCPFVLLFPPFTAGPISGRMKQTGLRNPGLRCSCFDVSLTDGTFCFWALCWALPPWKVHQGGLRGGLALKLGRLFSPQLGVMGQCLGSRQGPRPYSTFNDWLWCP